MTECAVCGGFIEPEAFAEVTVEFVDKEKYGPHPDEYPLHEWCAERIFGGWQKPT